MTVEYDMPGADQAEPGDAVSGGDVTDIQGGAVTIAAGEAQASIEIDPVDDYWNNGPELVRAWLSPSSDYDIGGASSAQFTLNDGPTDDYTESGGMPTVQITAQSSSITESGGEQQAFQITRDVQLNSTMVVHYEMDGDAIPGTDYAAPSGIVTLLPGQSEATIDLSPVDDAFAEGDRSVECRLVDDSRYQIGDSNYATLTLADDPSDTRPAISVETLDPIGLWPADASSPGSPASLRITRTGNTDSDLAVQYSVAGDATPGVDYAPLTGQAVIPAGQTSVDVEVTPVYGEHSDGEKTLTVSLDAATANGTEPSYLRTAINTATIGLGGGSDDTNPLVVAVDQVSFRHRKADSDTQPIPLADDKLTILFDPPKQTQKYKAPHWVDSNHNGVIDPGTNDRAYPIIYVKGQRADVDATFWVSDIAPFKGKTVWVKAGYNSVADFLPAIQATIGVAGFSVKDDRAAVTNAFAGPEYEPTFALNWQYSITGKDGTYMPAGVSSNPLHVTFQAPLPSAHLYRTSVFQATVAVYGATTEAEVRQKIWDGLPDPGGGPNLYSFSARTASTWEGKPLHYYLNWKTTVQTEEGLITPTTIDPQTKKPTGDGQCGAWAYHFQNVMRIHGFNYDLKQLRHKDGWRIMVKSWLFPPGAGPFENVISNEGGAGMIVTGPVGSQKYVFAKATVTDQQGIPGQWVANPASNFLNHIVVQVGSDLWDPSYGTIYLASNGGPTNNVAIAFQRQALDGYCLIENKAGKTVMEIKKPTDNADIIVKNFP